MHTTNLARDYFARFSSFFITTISFCCVVAPLLGVAEAQDETTAPTELFINGALFKDSVRDSPQSVTVVEEQRLVDQGQRLMIYVPCGEAWYPYFMRRRAERPRNVIFLATNVH